MQNKILGYVLLTQEDYEQLMTQQSKQGFFIRSSFEGVQVIKIPYLFESFGITFNTLEDKKKFDNILNTKYIPLIDKPKEHKE